MTDVDAILACDYNEAGLIMLARRLQKERDEARSELAEKRAEVRRLRLLLSALSDERFSLKVTLHPAIFNQRSFDIVQELQRHHARLTAHEVERHIGGPLRRLQEALMHIHYLENHAASSGLKFTPWSVTERDKSLYY